MESRNLNNRSKKNSFSCQPHFALALVMAYKTASTVALLVLSNLIAIHLQIKNEAVYENVWRLRKILDITITQQ